MSFSINSMLQPFSIATYKEDLPCPDGSYMSMSCMPMLLELNT